MAATRGEYLKAGLAEIERRIEGGEEVSQGARDTVTRLRHLETYVRNDLGRDLWAELTGNQAADEILLEMVAGEIEALDSTLADILAMVDHVVAVGMYVLQVAEKIADLWPL